MADSTSLVQSLISGLITGGSAMLTTVMAVFRDLRKRVQVLEERLGNPAVDAKSGLFLEVTQLSESLRKLRKEIESWSEEPPSWASRLRRSSSTNLSLEILQDYENRFEQRTKTIIDRVKRVEEIVEEHEKRVRMIYITKSEYEEDSRHRAEEIAKIQASLSSANGFLRGMMGALGYLDDPPTRRK